jgi:hypothetical protein
MKSSFKLSLLFLPLALFAQVSGFSPAELGLKEIPIPAVGSKAWLAMKSSPFQYSLDAMGELSFIEERGAEKPITLGVEGGFLYGTDFGEFPGASLSFIPEDPKKPPTEIFKGNVKALIKIGAEVYALTGSSLPGIDKGQAIKLGRKGEAWTLAKTIDLPECPSAACVDGSLAYIVGSAGLCSLSADSVLPLLKGQYWEGLRPGMVRKVSDLLCIGMRGSLAVYDLKAKALKAYARAR